MGSHQCQPGTSKPWQSKPHVDDPRILLAKQHRCLAPLHGLSFVTPQLIDMAARKVYSHRIQVVNAESERSLQYGGDLSAVEHYLSGYRAGRIIDEALERVEVPL